MELRVFMSCAGELRQVTRVSVPHGWAGAYLAGSGESQTEGKLCEKVIIRISGEQPCADWIWEELCWRPQVGSLFSTLRGWSNRWRSRKVSFYCVLHPAFPYTHCHPPSCMPGPLHIYFCHSYLSHSCLFYNSYCLFFHSLVWNISSQTGYILTCLSFLN